MPLKLRDISNFSILVSLLLAHTTTTSKCLYYYYYSCIILYYWQEEWIVCFNALARESSVSRRETGAIIPLVMHSVSSPTRAPAVCTLCPLIPSGQFVWNRNSVLLMLWGGICVYHPQLPFQNAVVLWWVFIYNWEIYRRQGTGEREGERERKSKSFFCLLFCFQRRKGIDLTTGTLCVVEKSIP